MFPFPMPIVTKVGQETGHNEQEASHPSIGIFLFGPRNHDVTRKNPPPKNPYHTPTTLPNHSNLFYRLGHICERVEIAVGKEKTNDDSLFLVVGFQIRIDRPREYNR
jgi:hypothetical protein